MLQRWLVSVTALCLSIGAITSAQDRATVQLRDGSRFEGRIEEMTTNELFVRVSLHDQRRVPISSVALIDRVGGGTGLPDTELREAAGSQHLLMLQGGSSLKGQLVAIRGGEGSANPNDPRTYVFRTSDGAQRSLTPDQVSRIYFGTYPGAGQAGTAPSTAANAGDLAAGNYVPGAIRVPATAGWVTTGMRVRRGEYISFDVTGQVQLSGNSGDRAHSAGAPRMAPGSPLPSVNAGALIGRVGNGQPFGIGDQASVPMPFDGVLFLAVNDDERGDNAGEFIVSLARRR
ncbi:MAG TPA: hypothetical protein VNT81_12800 [Vicinamibacterales bacterium]|nr:hypothetical protein [Vicinamibacterales bacterium]